MLVLAGPNTALRQSLVWQAVRTFERSEALAFGCR